MPTKPRTCAVQIALDIKRYGLPAVQQAVEMAVALSAPAAEHTKKLVKVKSVGAVGATTGSQAS